MNLTDTDYFRAGLAQAMAVGLNLQDVWRCAEHADTARAFDDAINELANMTPASVQGARMGGNTEVGE